MGFVRTPAEMAVIKRLAENPVHLVYYDRIMVTFETDVDFIRNVLPPCFQLADDAIGHATVASWKVPREKFMTATLNIRCKFQGEDGWYDLVHLISTDMASYFGRDMYGECKKVGVMNIDSSDQHVFATGARFGHRLIEIEADFGEDTGPQTNHGTAFGLQAHIGSDRCSLIADPVVHVIRLTEKRSTSRNGKGRIKFPGSDFDPSHTVPIGAIREITRAQGVYHMDSSRQTTLAGEKERYAPYIFGRFYDFALPEEGKISEILKEYDIAG